MAGHESRTLDSGRRAAGELESHALAAPWAASGPATAEQARIVDALSEENERLTRSLLRQQERH